MLRFALIGLNVLLSVGLLEHPAAAETCTTQSQMKGPERDSLATAARVLATEVQSNDTSALRNRTVSEFATNFAPLQALVADTAPKLTGGAVTVDQIYLLELTTEKSGQSSGAPQFFCSLNQSTNSVQLTIPGLAPGVYGFAVVQVNSAVPWTLPMLLKREQDRWLLAGIYPHATTSAGHDGLWYWRQARQFHADKQPWNAWLYYAEAELLLQPASFVQSSHLEKLQDEQKAAAPPALSAGIGQDVPLVVKAKGGQEFRFTALTTDDSLAGSKPDVSAHVRVNEIGDAASARKRNDDAMRALLDAYPELRRAFHGVWIVSEAPNSAQAPFATEEPMSSLP